MSVRTGRVRRLGTHGNGHKQVLLHRDGKQYKCFVHALVLEAFVAPRPDGMVCCHNNGDPADNRVENLRWGTASDNMQDSLKHGTHYEAAMQRCIRGHLFTGPNLTTRQDSRAGRKCLACKRAKTRLKAAGKRIRGNEAEMKRLSDSIYAEVMSGQLLL